MSRVSSDQCNTWASILYLELQFVICKGIKEYGSAAKSIASPLCELTYGITQYYLPPGKGDIRTFTTAN